MASEMLPFSGSISLDKLFTNFGRKVPYNSELLLIKSVLDRRQLFSGYPEMLLKFSLIFALYDFAIVTKSTLHGQFFVIVTKALGGLYLKDRSSSISQRHLDILSYLQSSMSYPNARYPCNRRLYIRSSMGT